MPDKSPNLELPENAAVGTREVVSTRGDAGASEQTETKHSELARQIENQRKHLQQMVSTVPGIVWEAWGEPDAAGQRIDFVSDYVETMLGYTVEEWTSTPNFWLSIVHPDDRESAARNAATTFLSDSRGTNQFRWMTKNGKTLWVESHSVAVLDETGKRIGMRGVTMDITERRRKQSNENFLAEASTVLSQSFYYKATLSTVARLAVPHFADWCAVDVVDKNGILSRVAVAHVEPEKVAWAREIYERYPPKPDEEEGLYKVLRTGKSEFYPEITDEMLAHGALDAEHLEILRKMNFRSCMLVPLKTQGRILGVLTFVNTTSSRNHTAEDLALAENLANRAALAVENARLFQAERQSRRAAERTSNLLRRLQAVSSALSQALTPQDVAAAAVEQAANSLGAHAGAIVLLGESGAELEIVGSSGFSADVSAVRKRFSADADTPSAVAVREKMPVIIESVGEQDDEQNAGFPELNGTLEKSRALAVFPLTVEGRTTGALVLNFPQPQNFTEDDRVFMQSVAQQCAQAVERARLYEMERELRAVAETANQIKDEFLATVSHELRTPLNAILGWTKILKSGNFDSEFAARAVDTIDRNARIQTQIVEDLLDVSRIITGEIQLRWENVELDSIVEATLDEVFPTAEKKGVVVRADFNSQATVRGDAARLRQVVWNLISNAVKFTPDGGIVEVKIERRERSVEIVVADSGQGISPEFLPFVFERFRQADGTTTRKYGGLGLGLSIVRYFVEMHGGSIRAASDGAGCGTTFTVVLPAAEHETPAEAQ